MDFDSLDKAGTVMGSGGMIVIDDDTCMVEFAKYFLTFAAAESCGKCVPCRIGGQRLLEAVTRITEGKGTRKDLQIIKDVSQNMMNSSLCGLGQRTPGPVLSALRFFEQEFSSHIDDKICLAGQCQALVRAKCINTCPAGVNTPAYLTLVAQGRYAEGLAIHRRRISFTIRFCNDGNFGRILENDFDRNGVGKYGKQRISIADGDSDGIDIRMHSVTMPMTVVSRE